MIQQNVKIEKREAMEYPPIPENVYQAELLDITMVQVDKYKKPGEKENVLSFQFVLLNGKDKNENLRGRNIWRNYVPMFLYVSIKNGKNVLYQIIEAMRDHELSPEEEATLDSAEINSLIGKQCRIVTENTKKDDKVYSNIKKFLPVEGLLTHLTAEEKEKAKVKNKKETSGETTEIIEEEIPIIDEERIDPKDIPF